MRPVTFSELSNLYFEGYSAVWARKQMLRLMQANPVLKADFEGGSKFCIQLRHLPSQPFEVPLPHR